MHFEKINIHLNLFKSRIILNLKYSSDTYEINVKITLLHETHHWLLGRGDLGFEGHGMLQPSATSGFDIQNLVTGSGALLGGGEPSRVTNFTPADSVQRIIGRQCAFIRGKTGASVRLQIMRFRSL